MVCRWARCRVLSLGWADVVLGYLLENRWTDVSVAGLGPDTWAVATAPCSRRQVLHWGCYYCASLGRSCGAVHVDGDPSSVLGEHIAQRSRCIPFEVQTMQGTYNSSSVAPSLVQEKYEQTKARACTPHNYPPRPKNAQNTLKMCVSPTVFNRPP